MDVVSLDQDRWLALAAHIATALADNAAGCLNVAQLRSLNGRLAWAAKVIIYGRINTSALFQAVRNSGLGSAPKRIAAQATLSLSPAAVADLLWWRDLCAMTGPGVRPPGTRLSTILSGPHRAGPTTITVHTDASGIGLGAWCGNEWLFMPMAAHIRLSGPAAAQDSTSSGAAEAAAVLAALLTWGPRFPFAHFEFFSDSSNVTVVDGWAAQYSPKPSIVPYLRAFAHVCTLHGISLALTHIPGITNVWADLISRGQFARFLALHPQALQQPLAPPSASDVWLEPLPSQPC
jgi:hypothetical protein